MKDRHRATGMSRIRRALSLGSAALALGSGLALTASTGAGAVVSPSPAWAEATGITVPTGGSTTAPARLLGVGCASDGTCVAAGAFEKSATAGDLPMVVTGSGGTWGTGHQLSLPSDAASSPKAVATDASCPTSTTCAVIGYYRYTNSGTKRNVFVAQESGSTWGKGQHIPLPKNNATPTNAYSGHIACSSPGNCAAAGVYVDKDTDHEAFYISEKNGTWSQAHWVVPPPSPAAPSVGKNNMPYGVSCPSDGNCVEVGKYLTTKGDYQPFIQTETNGTWDPAAIHISLPAGAMTTKSQTSELHGVSCTSVGNCVAIGDYFTGSGQRAVFSVTETNGTWDSQGTEQAAAPAGAANPPVPYLNAVTCFATGECVAVGNYTTSAGQTEAMSLAFSAGSWQPADAPQPPTNVSTSAAMGSILNAVGCWGTPWSCVGVGSYTNTGDHQRAMAASSS
jgi:hypothetical protein